MSYVTVPTQATHKQRDNSTQNVRTVNIVNIVLFKENSNIKLFHWLRRQQTVLYQKILMSDICMR